MHTPLKGMLALLCCAALAGCSGIESQPTGPHHGTAPEAEHTDETGGAAAAQRLRAYHWQLQQVSGPDRHWFAQGQAALQQPLQLDFDGSHLGISGLCNRIRGSYALQDQTIRIGQGISTKMACIDARLMALENQVAAQLPQAQRWSLSGTDTAPELQLHFANGSTWQLRGIATDETRYGSAPERIFLEVAPQTRSCNDGSGARQCLEVRRVEFDAAGLRRSTGPSELFYEPIEGFVHEPGIRNVLRINRYTRPSAPADASRYVYVLDMRVSAEIAR